MDSKVSRKKRIYSRSDHHSSAKKKKGKARFIFSYLTMFDSYIGNGKGNKKEKVL